jgi:hypothetical protein
VRKIKARGIYRDPVRSSHGHFVKASGLRWLSFMVLTPVPWAMCVKALPVLTILAPSERADHLRGRRRKLLTDRARQGMLQLCRWLPGRSIVFVGDSSFAVHELAHAVSGRANLSAACVSTPVCLRRPRVVKLTASDDRRRKAPRCRSVSVRRGPRSGGLLQ